jgi:hypothetical protein
MKCENCKKLILNPVEHEFCVFSSKPAPRIRKIVGPSVKADEYVAPKVQGQLKHQMAAPGAKAPPQRRIVTVQGNLMVKDESEEDGYRALARRLSE